jgi:signal transduction histidine kinase
MKRRGRAAELAEHERQGAEARTAVDAAFYAVDEAVARERVRMARELHDGLASDLSTAVALFKYYFEAAQKTPDAEEVLRNVFEIMEALLENTRNTLRDMRPRRLGPHGLVAELRSTAEEYGRVYGIRVELWSSGNEEDLSQGQREVVFHIVREALTNVRRHSGTSTCRVRLGFAARPFLIEVTDEGKGFESGGGGGYGLVGMRERAAGIGGRLEVVSTPGRGTTVFLFGPDPAGTY